MANVKHVYHSLKQSLSFCPQRSLRELRDLRSYSTVSLGKHFEKVTVVALTRLSFDVSACGGPKDRGVDFRGRWRLKGSCVPVVGQCKKYKKRLGPRHVREMEGVLGRESQDTLGILVSAQGYTKDAYDACMGSSYSLALTVLQGFVDSDLHVEPGGIEASSLERGSRVIGCAMEGLDAAEGVSTLQSYHSVPQDLRGSDDDSGGLGDYIQENQVWETQPNSGSKIGFNNHSSKYARPSTNPSLISDETGKGKCVKNPLTDDRVIAADEAGWKDNFTTSGRITLFELNPAARKLLPHVFIGTTYKGKHARSPEIMFVEDDSTLHVKSE